MGFGEEGWLGGKVRPLEWEVLNSAPLCPEEKGNENN